MQQDSVANAASVQSTVHRLMLCISKSQSLSTSCVKSKVYVVSVSV